MSPRLPLLLLLAAPLWAMAGSPTAEFGLAAPSATHALYWPALDVAKLSQEDGESLKPGVPYRYALSHTVKGVAVKAGQVSGEGWLSLPDGRMLWRQEIVAEDASSIDVGLSDVFLPHGAELWLSAADGSYAQGPYTEQHNHERGVLWTALVPGERALLEVVVPRAQQPYLRLQLSSVQQGYRDIFKASLPDPNKAGSCNVDTVCTEGNNWRDQIQSVGRYTFVKQGTGRLCTGQLINRTSADRAPLFLTANHCLDTQTEAESVVLYWNYQSATCRTVGSAANGQSLPISLATHTQSGASLLATYAPSDFTLLRLSQPVPNAANPYWTGWDRRDLAPAAVTAIHHPQGHEKRISFENDPLSISSYLGATGSGTTHLRVADWDLGTTEGGSSGSGIWNADKRLVGQLHGGNAACGNDLPDWYGRLAVSWAGGGTAATRLSDHLDPAGSAPQFLDGVAGCTAPTATINASVDPVPAGSDVLYVVNASGGSGSGYSYAWDVEGDGVIDRSGSNNSLSVRYDRVRQFSLRVTVTDGAGCATQVSRAMTVTAPSVRATAVSLGATQLCGDGDTTVEPGERWSFNADLLNAGTRATGTDAVALFSKQAADTLDRALRDGFGYAATDSVATPGVCGYNWVDIAGQTPLTLTAAPGAADARDDGRSTTIQVSGADSFELYGQPVTEVVMSTNGYLGTNAATTGGDFRNECDSTPDADSNGRRLQVLHDDLVAGALRTAVFPSCPRPSDAGGSNQRCLVFTWSGMGLYNASGAPSGNFDFQAIVYPGTKQIVYQYRNASPGDGAGATIGLLNPGNTQQLLNYGCNAPTATAGRAVCIFHPQGQPQNIGDATKVRLENAVLPLGGLGANESRRLSNNFSIDPSTSCGSRYNLAFVGAADQNAGSVSDSALTFTVGASGNCNVSTNCPLNLPPAVNLRHGSFYNPRRSGNGLVVSVVPQAQGNPVFFAIWYTGEANRQPTWYTIQGPLQDNQVVAPILKFTRNTQATTFTATPTAVGQATLQFTGPESILFSYRFTGGLAGTEFYQHLFAGLAPTSANRTGSWYLPAESGWGQTYDSYRTAAGQAREFVGSFIYDASGEPRWVLADLEAGTNATGPAGSFRVACPGCGWFEFGDTATVVGNMTRRFDSATAGALTTGFTLPTPLSGVWNRNAIPIQILTPVQPPQ